ncbi:MAG TPA: NADH-quinone oxidoreductase subunit L [Nevskiaceae bacterium]|nr:NADH-quinone oxidoreductase subunit L [Nevskiaceae bacterium]
MLDLLFLVFLAPLLGFLILAFTRGRLGETGSAVVGVGSVGISALLTALIGATFLSSPPEGGAYTQLLWTWMSVDGFAPAFALRLDGLSLTMMGVITGVGFFIHLFAAWYMRGDEAYARFFSYMNLFVASMLFLVLGDNLLFVYFGWEGVGVASYLLIGFWYQDAANGAAARKAFVVTRVGDTFMAIGLFILFHQFGTLEIQPLMAAVREGWAQGPAIATVAALLLLGGAVGKSAQLPLQTWLPDAMAGPTPVSALIHAATMVTAGVYLIARTHPLFEVAPYALDAVAWVGAITLLMAGFIALTQTDIKKILAYSTMSQIGYMFLALGVGAYQPAVFHLMTHAFFKALLFLSAGSVILACHHEQDIFRMGGLRKQIPLTYWCFLIGSLALIAFPYSSGYFSKEEILFEAWYSGEPALFWLGLAGAFMTALYTFRLIFIAFFGESHLGSADAHGQSAYAHDDGHAHDPGHGHGVTVPTGLSHHLPLIVLAVFSVIGGLIHLPLDGVLPARPFTEEQQGFMQTLGWISLGVSGAGVALAWLIYGSSYARSVRLRDSRNPLLLWWRAAFGWDWLYDRLFVKPYLFIVHINRRDGVDQLITLIPDGFRSLNGLLTQTQTGHLRWYAAALAGGAVLVIGATVFA